MVLNLVNSIAFSSSKPLTLACINSAVVESELNSTPSSFVLPSNSKEDGVEFSSDSTTAEFMQAKVKGFEEEKAMLLGSHVFT
jgi:hypothetical protein